MSVKRITAQKIEPIVKQILEDAAQKNRKFVETIELQIALKDYDPQKDRRFSGVIRLGYPTKANFKVLVLGDSYHCQEAQRVGIDFLSVNALKAIHRNNKVFKRILHKYQAVVASDNIIRQIPRIMGPSIGRAGKFPSVLSHNESLQSKVHQLQCSVRFQLKKYLCMAVSVGNVSLTTEQVISNVLAAIDFLAGLLKRGWRNIKNLNLKSTMGKPHRIYVG